MTEYNEILLDQDAFKYMQVYLGNGNMLSKYLLQVLNTNEGKILTYLPSDIGIGSVKDFQFGGKISVTQPPVFLRNKDSYAVLLPNTNFWLVPNIQDYLSKAPHRICIFEDVTSRPCDPFLNSLAGKYFSVGDEIYFTLSSGDYDENKIMGVIQNVRSQWHFVCAMTSIVKDVEIQKPSPSLLQHFAERVTRIVVGAYDGESYLIWYRM